MKTRLAGVFILLMLVQQVQAQDTPRLSEIDRTRRYFAEKFYVEKYFP